MHATYPRFQWTPDCSCRVSHLPCAPPRVPQRTVGSRLLYQRTYLIKCIHFSLSYYDWFRDEKYLWQKASKPGRLTVKKTSCQDALLVLQYSRFIPMITMRYIWQTVPVYVLGFSSRLAICSSILVLCQETWRLRRKPIASRCSACEKQKRGTIARWGRIGE